MHRLMPYVGEWGDGGPVGTCDEAGRVMDDWINSVKSYDEHVVQQKVGSGLN